MSRSSENPDPLGSLGQLLGRYAALVKRVVGKVSGGRAQDPEEIEQQVLEALWKAAREQTIDHPTSYVYRIAVRETVRALRRQQGGPLAAPDGTLEALPGPGPDPEKSAAGRELGAAVEEVLRRLQPERALAARASLAGFSVEELMEAQGWPYQKARNLIARGVADLRAALRAEGIDGD